jgi:undecaprenyl-diphosphatase
MLRPIPHPVVTVICGAIAVLAVAAFGFLFAKTRPITRLDFGVDQGLSRHHVASLSAIAHGVYTAFSPIEAIALTVVITAIIWIVSRSFRSAITFALTVAVSWLSSDIVKILVDRPRPLASALAHPFLPTPSDPSYPSGHVVFAASIAIAFIILVRATAVRALVAVLGVLLVLVVGSAVLYLGVHYPSDVLGSIVWSIGACALFLTFWNHVVIPRTFRGRTVAK